MVMVAEHYDYVIGGDPDRDTVDLAVMDASTGAVRAQIVESADGPGYARLLEWGRQHAPGRRVWALEGTASFAVGLVASFTEAGEDIIEVSGIKPGSWCQERQGRRRAGRSPCPVDRASSHSTITRSPRGPATRAQHTPCRSRQPNESRQRAQGRHRDRPEDLRAGLRGISLAKQLDRIAELASPDSASVEYRVTVSTLRSITARIRFLSAQISDLDPELKALVAAHAAGPALLAEPGVGPVVAAQLLVSWSHRGRVRNEAAFAALSGTAPLEASSGQRSRHRLNRGGDRDLNRALHTIAITRLRCHPETMRYESNRTTQGKTHRDIRRSIKRALARRLYRRIQAATAPLPLTAAA